MVTQIREQTTDQFFYRSVTPSNRHRHHVSVYLVERINGSNVVARIEPLGLVHVKLGDQELVIKGLHRNLALSGRWHSTPSQRHARVRVVRVPGDEG
jgi:hypothetical protein